MEKNKTNKQKTKKAINGSLNKLKVEKTTRVRLRVVQFKLSQKATHVLSSSCLYFPYQRGGLFPVHTCGCISRPHLQVWGNDACVLWLSALCANTPDMRRGSRGKLAPDHFSATRSFYVMSHSLPSPSQPCFLFTIRESASPTT